MKRFYDKYEFIRFAIIGGVSAGVYFVGLYFLLGAFSLVVSAVAAYASAMVVNYLCQRAWTFKSDRRHDEALPRYLVVQLGGMALNAGTLEFFTTQVEAQIAVGQAIALCVIAAWSYLMQKVWVFTA